MRMIYKRKMGHENEIRKFLEQVVKGKKEEAAPERFWGSMIGSIPPELIDANKIEYTSLVLYEEEKEQFYKIYNQLRADIQTEYLSDKELKDSLWWLTCDVFIQRDALKNGKLLKDRIKQFIDEICKPLETCEVMFSVLNLQISRPLLDFWGCTIEQFSRQQLLDWGLNQEFDKNAINELQDKALLIIRENGTGLGRIVDRARQKARLKLKALQVFLSELV